MGQSVKIIAIYSMKTLCFSTVIDRDTGQVVEIYNGRKKGLYSSLMIVNWLWVVVCLIVVFNIAFNGPDRFYGPTGFCKPMRPPCVTDIDCHRVLDSAPLLSPTHRC